MDVSEKSGTQQPWVFLLKMIILGCFGGTTIYGNTHMYPLHSLKYARNGCFGSGVKFALRMGSVEYLLDFHHFGTLFWG